MEDLNLHLIIFSVILAFAQSFNLMRSPVEEKHACEDSKHEKIADLIWSKFVNQPNLPEDGDKVSPTFHLCRRGRQLEHLVILIHGFNSKKSAWAASMAETIFAKDTRDNLGVLTVDWRKGAGVSTWWDLTALQTSYNRAAANTRYVGLATQLFVQGLEGRLEGPAPRVHCIGHSLGAHACGFFAKEMAKQQGEKVWRVTGLDPAGPQFTTELIPDYWASFRPVETAPADQRLDAGDAELVDVIHTDGDQLGTMMPLGDIDFYVGKSLETLGRKQTDCHSGDICDHTKSIQVFRESLGQQHLHAILTCRERERSLDMCEETADVPTFGYFLNENSKTGVFGVLEKEPKDDNLEETTEWWNDDFYDETISATPQEVTTTIPTRPIPAEETSTLSTKDGEEENVRWRALASRTNIIVLSVLTAFVCFILLSLIVFIYVSSRKAKVITVPDLSDEALLP